MNKYKFFGEKFHIGRFLPAALCLLSLFFAAGCAGREDGAPGEEDFTVVASNFPGYDFVRELTGGRACVKLLLKPGMESHAYEPSPQDILAVKNCDLFVYVGGESEAWIDTILDSFGEERPATFRMTDHTSLLQEEEASAPEDAAGTQKPESPGGHAGHSHPEVPGEPEYDEHVWTSPKRAMAIVSALSETLLKADGDAQRQKFYRDNSSRYLAELEDLDARLEAIVENGKRRFILVADRFPFLYLATDYGLKHREAFAGCSAETDPSVASLSYLVREIRKESVPYVFYIELSNQKVADILKEETGAGTLLLHSCQTLSSDEFKAGASYLKLMGQNCDNLEKALNDMPRTDGAG